MQRPRPRAETAELLGLRPARFDPRWREIDVGSWGGRVAAEVDALGPELTNWRGGPRKAADGESWDDFSARVAGAVDELVAAGGPWMVVCHGGCIRVAVAHVTGADPLHLGSPPNASATIFELGTRPRLLVYGSLPDGGLPTPARSRRASARGCRTPPGDARGSRRSFVPANAATRPCRRRRCRSSRSRRR